MESLQDTYVPIQIVVGMQNNRGIGKGNDLVVKSKADLKRFRQITKGGVVIMGRRTFESLPNGPLEGRVNLVLTRDSSYHLALSDSANDATPVVVVDSVYEALAEAVAFHQDGFAKGIYVIGGGQIYEDFLPYTSKIHMTRFPNKELEPDTWFPDLSEKPEWSISSMTTVVSDVGREQVIEWVSSKVVDYRKLEPYKNEIGLIDAYEQIESEKDNGVYVNVEPIYNQWLATGAKMSSVTNTPVRSLLTAVVNLDKNDPLSGFYPTPFTLPSTLFKGTALDLSHVTLSCVCQGYYYLLMLLFGDIETAEKIQRSDDLDQWVNLSRGSPHYQLESEIFIGKRIWAYLVLIIVNTNSTVREALIATGDKPIVAHLGYGSVMGVGLKADQVDYIEDYYAWQGENFHGDALVWTRDNILKPTFPVGE